MGKKSESNSNPKYSGSHFNSDGLSQGPKTGAIRPTKDAYSEQKLAQKPADPSPRKPAQ